MIILRGKWALITGASRGVGYQLAHLMADQGCHLILHSRTLDGTQNLETELLAKDIEVKRVAAELSSEIEIIEMLKAIDGFGVCVDIVFNNAGIQVPYRSDYTKTPVSDYDLSFKVNTIAPALICYHFLPKMMEKGFGRIVNTTSGIQHQPEQGGYSASKAALDKITIDLGSKLEGSDVMINLTDPGWLRTDLGGPNAPNAPNDVTACIPGVAVGAFLDDRKSGRCINSSDYVGMTLEEAVELLESKL